MFEKRTIWWLTFAENRHKSSDCAWGWFPWFIMHWELCPYCTRLWYVHTWICNLILDLFNRVDQKLFERVRRRVTKLVPELRHLPYQERLCHLDLPSLYHWRWRSTMIAILQVQSGGINEQPNQFFEAVVLATTSRHKKAAEAQCHDKSPNSKGTPSGCERPMTETH